MLETGQAGFATMSGHPLFVGKVGTFHAAVVGDIFALRADAIYLL